MLPRGKIFVQYCTARRRLFCSLKASLVAWLAKRFPASLLVLTQVPRITWPGNNLYQNCTFGIGRNAESLRALQSSKPAGGVNPFYQSD